MSFAANYTYLTTTLLWILFYNLVYQVLRFLIKVPSKIAKTSNKKKRESEYSYYVFSHLSLFHAIVNLFVSTGIILSRPIYYLEVNQPDVLNLLSFSIGYYSSNMMMGMVYKFHPISMICHHLIVLSEIMYVFWSGYFGNIIVLGFAIAETSNPFRIIKNICDGHDDRKYWGDFSIHIFAVVFLFMRLFKQTNPLSNISGVHST